MAVELKRVTLARLNLLKGGEGDSQVLEIFEKYRIERDAPKPAGNLPVQTIPQPDHEAIRQERRRRDVSHNVSRLFKGANCPRRHIEHIEIVDEGQNSRWIAVRDLLVEQARYANGFLVVLLGIRGVGKTQLCVSVIHRCCQSQLTCAYIKALDLFRDLRRGFAQVGRGERAEREDDLATEWVKPDVLVVDELHERAETQFEQNSLINLLDRRYDAMKCTILIANQTKEEFASAMGDSVVSRIHETGEPIACDWTSYRKPGSWRQGNGARLREPSGKLRNPDD